MDSDRFMAMDLCAANTTIRFIFQFYCYGSKRIKIAMICYSCLFDPVTDGHHGLVNVNTRNFFGLASVM